MIDSSQGGGNDAIPDWIASLTGLKRLEIGALVDWNDLDHLKHVPDVFLRVSGFAFVSNDLPLEVPYSIEAVLGLRELHLCHCAYCEGNCSTVLLRH